MAPIFCTKVPRVLANRTPYAKYYMIHFSQYKYVFFYLQINIVFGIFFLKKIIFYLSTPKGVFGDLWEDALLGELDIRLSKFLLRPVEYAVDI